MTVEQHQHAASLEILTAIQGLTAGLVAAVVMAAVAMVGSSLAGQGIWAPVNAIGSLFQPGVASGAGFLGGTTLLGMLIHLVTGTLLGVLYASAQERIDNRSLIIIAVYYGLVAWFVSTFIVLSWLKPSLQVFMRTWPMLVGHLAYGAVLGVFASLRNR